MGPSAQRRRVALAVSFVLAVSIALGPAFSAIPAAASTCTNCTPVGIGNSNYNVYPFQASGAAYPATSLTVGVQINTTMSASGYFTGETEGCTTDDQWTYQNNFFDPSGEFIQEVLAVGLTQSTPSCWTVEWGPPGTTQVYNYMAVEVPAVYTPDFQTAGNTLNFVVAGTPGANGEVYVTAFDLYLNGQMVGTLNPSQMLNYSTGQLLNGADGPVFYTTSTGQNFDIVGPGGGQDIVFSSGSGTMSYCGAAPNSPPELGGLIGSQTGTVENSNIFYGNVTASGASCSQAPSSYSQFFNVLPSAGSSGPSQPSNGTPGCNYGAASSGVDIFFPTCSGRVTATSLTITGNDSLPAGNYATGQPGQALGFPCNNGNTANPPGCPAEPQLNFLQAWVSGYNSGSGTFQVQMTMSDLTGLATVPPPGQGQLWSFQWTYAGTTYFAQMDEWLTNEVSASSPALNSGPFQLPGITFWYGTVTESAVNTGTPAGGLQFSNYNHLGTISGSYTAQAPGTITLTIPTSDVGNPTAGSEFTNVMATTAQVYGTYDTATASYFGMQLLNNPDTVYAPLPYSLGAPLLPMGYVQVAVLAAGQTPGASTSWSPAAFVNYPTTNDWSATIGLSGSAAGTYEVYAREFNSFTGSAGPSTTTEFTYAPNVILSLSPTSGTVAPGKSTSTVATVGGGVQTVYLTVGTLPSGVSVSWKANPVASSAVGVKDTITFYASRSATKGTHDVTVTAIGSDGSTTSTTYVLNVS